MSDAAECSGTGKLWHFSPLSNSPVCQDCRGLPSTIKVEDPGREWFMTPVPAHQPHVPRFKRAKA